MDTHVYEVNLKWEKDRIGIVSSPDLEQSITVATPPEFPKGVPNIWSPEHFYAAAINSCFMTTFLAVAENSKLEFTSFECQTVIKLEKVERKFLITEAEIKPRLKLVDPSENNVARAEKVLQKSEEHCLVSNSMKTKMILTTTVE